MGERKKMPEEPGWLSIENVFSRPRKEKNLVGRLKPTCFHQATKCNASKGESRGKGSWMIGPGTARCLDLLRSSLQIELTSCIKQQLLRGN